MSRLNPPETNKLSPEQREVYDEITAGPRGAVRGPLGIWLWRAEFASRAQALGQYCRYDSSLPARLSELAILVTARHWNAEFEWQHHKQSALNAGLDAGLVEAIRQGNTPDFFNEDERSVYFFATELQKNKLVSEATYDNAVKILGRDTVVDLVGVLGYYALISMTINAFQVDAPGANELNAS